MSDVAATVQVLPQGAGWGVIFGLGVGFAFLMLLISWMQSRYAGVDLRSNEEFISASRSLKKGLVASGIVSAWTWAATLLQSSTVAYTYGVSGPFWYAAGATVQVLLFAMLAAKIKANSPFCNTFLQIIKARWGTVAHVSFLCFALATSALVSAQLLLGGSATVSALTGIPTLAANFLIPVAVACFAVIGGQRSVFVADYTHTSVLACMLVAFCFVVYAKSDLIGSPSRMAELLALQPPVDGNAGGSYLTFRSLKGLQFGIINICGNFATVFADQAYAQRAIASDVESSTPAFILGGLVWTAVPLAMASSLGLAARALVGQTPKMAVLTSSQVSEGLAAPAAAAALMGSSGAAAMLITLFFAVTSATSAELLSIASVGTYDVWKAYIRPRASEKELYSISHVALLCWMIIMSLLGMMFYYIGISLGWVYLAMGVIVCPAAFPIFCAICWSKANKTSAIVSLWLSALTGMAVWFGTAKAMYGEVTVDSTGKNEPVLAGNLVSLILPILIMVPWSFLAPENYDWTETRSVQHPNVTGNRVEDEMISSSNGSSTSKDMASPALPADAEKGATNEKATDGLPETTAPPLARVNQQVTNAEYDASQYSGSEYLLVAGGLDPEKLRKAFSLARSTALALTFILILFMPCMMIIPRIWSHAEFTAWIAIVITWIIISAAILCFLPIFESRAALVKTAKGIWTDIVTLGGHK